MANCRCLTDFIRPTTTDSTYLLGERQRPHHSKYGLFLSKGHSIWLFLYARVSFLWWRWLRSCLWAGKQKSDVHTSLIHTLPRSCILVAHLCRSSSSSKGRFRKPLLLPVGSSVAPAPGSLASAAFSALHVPTANFPL